MPEIFLEVKWGATVGAVSPVGSRGKAPGQGIRGTSTPEADGVLLIQQQNFCVHNYVYAEMQR